MTPHPEITLIRENNLAAAVAFGKGVSWFLSAVGKYDCGIHQRLMRL